MNYFILGPDSDFKGENREQLDDLVAKGKVKLFEVVSQEDYTKCIKQIAEFSKNETAINLVCSSHGERNGKMCVGADRYPEEIIEDINKARVRKNYGVLEKIRGDFFGCCLGFGVNRHLNKPSNGRESRQKQLEEKLQEPNSSKESLIILNASQDAIGKLNADISTVSRLKALAENPQMSDYEYLSKLVATNPSTAKVIKKNGSEIKLETLSAFKSLQFNDAAIVSEIEGQRKKLAALVGEDYQIPKSQEFDRDFFEYYKTKAAVFLLFKEDKRGDERLEELLKSGSLDVNAVSGKSSLLHFCCQEDDTESKTEILLKNGADANFLSPLNTAVRGNSIANIALLVKYGADVNKYHDRINPLTRGCKNGKESLEAVEELLKSPQIDVNLQSQDHLQTPLMFAAANKEGAKYLLPKLLAAGADQELLDKKNRSALRYAALSDNREALEILINDEKTAPEFLLSQADKILRSDKTSEEIKTFLSSKISVLEQLVAKNNQDNLFEDIEIIFARASFDAKMKKTKRDFGKLARFFKKHEGDLDINHVSRSGNTILTFAACEENKELLDFIIKEKGEKIDFAKSIKILDELGKKTGNIAAKAITAATLLKESQAALEKAQRPSFVVENDSAVNLGDYQRPIPPSKKITSR